jgi:hypothetical protein
MSKITRVGIIGATDHRFLGRSVFGDLNRESTHPGDPLVLALTMGATLDADDREALRLIAVCTTSPDARIWPLKLCRLLASHGDATAGFFGAQLVAGSGQMGPGVSRNCAEGFVYIAEHSDDDAALETAVLAWRDRFGGRFPGFGVALRAQDERLLAIRRLVAGTGLEGRPFWRLQARVAEALAKHGTGEPNVVFAIAALLLDVGIPAANCGLVASTLMTHVYLAQAIEAARDEGPDLHAMPASVVDYRGAPPRHTSEPVDVQLHPALHRVHRP